MKKFNVLLTLTVMTVLILSSCSQQRYASRKKVHIGDQAQNEVQKAPRQQALQIESKTQELSPKLETVKPEKKTARAVKKHKEILGKLKSAETKAYLKDVAKNPQKLKQILNKESNSQKKEFEAKTGIDTSSKWFRLMILGLIIMVAGYILEFFIGFGNLISFVGSILFLVGFILWLLEII
ncbi:MAG: hypothetical protein GC180_00540 [Bacteroidetes bacterium]|nr:hypothetical protein [Bacteroidota bacterium]